MRGRGLDALFESAQPDAAPEPEIDEELAAMLYREVRAGAPPVEGLSAIPSAKDRPGSADSEAATTREAVAAPGPIMAERERREETGTPAATADEAIDVPLPVEEAPAAGPTAPQPVQPSPAAPTTPVGGGAPVTPSPAASPPSAAPATPSAPAPEAGAAPAPVAGEQPVQPPIRIGAVIIDSTTPATQPSAAPAGELVPATQPAPQVVIPATAGREVMPPGPGMVTAAPQLPSAQTLDEEKKKIIIGRLNANLESGWQRALHSRIDELYKQPPTQFSSPPANADRMLTLLQEARQILIESPENYVAVEARLMQVQTTITRTTESRIQAAHYGPRILGYELVWLTLFLLGLVFAAPLTAFFKTTASLTGTASGDLFTLWNTLMWGGIGGIIGALYALWWHVSDRQDFERQYLMWYLVQPIMGLVLGGIVFLLLSGGFLLLQVQPSDSNVGARLVPYLVAVLAGFRQNFIYGQFDRLIALFTPGASQGEGEQKKG